MVNMSFIVYTVHVYPENVKFNKKSLDKRQIQIVKIF